MATLADNLADRSRPVFTFGATPPRAGADEEQGRAVADKFARRSSVLALDGFIVYDVQEEAGRTSVARPFPFRRMADPSWYAKLLSEQSQKPCCVYKCVVEADLQTFDGWLDRAVGADGHTALNIVGGASSSRKYTGPSMEDASVRVKRVGARFGAVMIAERHTKKGNEHLNMVRKQHMGAEWFVSQAIYDAAPIVRLVTDYAALCRTQQLKPNKIVLTFAPCGRRKTLSFIKWLGVNVPDGVQDRLFPDAEGDGGSAGGAVSASVELLVGVLETVLAATAGCHVPLGINVESLSIYREEIDAAHTLFTRLQKTLLDASGSPWIVSWHRCSELEASDAPKPFDKAGCWLGARPGRVFRLGSEGLGYYEDKRPVVTYVPAPMAAGGLPTSAVLGVAVLAFAAGNYFGDAMGLAGGEL